MAAFRWHTDTAATQWHRDKGGGVHPLENALEQKQQEGVQQEQGGEEGVHQEQGGEETEDGGGDGSEVVTEEEDGDTLGVAHAYGGPARLGWYAS